MNEKQQQKKKNVSSGLRSTIKWQAGKHMARQEERSKFYWWLLRYLQQPKNTYINIPDILAAQTRVRTSAEGAHTMWDTQVLELQPAAPPLSNLFLHTSIASTTFCAIHLQMSLLIAVTTTRGLLKTRQACGACWASLSLSAERVSGMKNLRDCCEFIMNRNILTSVLYFCLLFSQKTADVCVLKIWSHSINRATFVESTTVDNKFSLPWLSEEICWEFCTETKKLCFWLLNQGPRVSNGGKKTEMFSLLANWWQLGNLSAVNAEH